MTPRQEAMVDYIRTYIAANGYAPSHREMIEAGLCSSTSVVNYNLMKLRDAGALTFDEGKARTLRVIEPVTSPAPLSAAADSLPAAGVSGGEG